MFHGCGSRSIMENTELLIDAIKETGQEVNADKNKYMAMSRDQNAGQSLIVSLQRWKSSNIWEQP